MNNSASAPLPHQFTVLAPHYDELMDIVPYRDWVDYIELLWRVVDHQAHEVLDCACGTGNVTFELARFGYQPTGIDISAGMIKVAQQKALSWSHTPIPDFIEADLTDFHLDQTFDSATCLYDSLNYILEPAALQAAFAHIADHIRPNGVFVFDMNSEFALTTDLFSQRNRDPRKRLHYEWKASYDEATRICSVTMNFRRQLPNGQIEAFDEIHRERSYSLKEVEAMLTATGWKLLRTFDAYTLNPPHRRSERWYFVARRTGAVRSGISSSDAGQ